MEKSAISRWGKRVSCYLLTAVLLLVQQQEVFAMGEEEVQAEEIKQAEGIEQAVYGAELSTGDTFDVGEIKYYVRIPSLKEVIAYGVADGTTLSGTVTIPATVDYDGVTYYVGSIQQEAFKDCTQIQKVVIADGIEKVGIGAFKGCTGIEEVELPESVNVIYWEAFSGCTALRTVKMPSSMSNIYNSAFMNCSSLESIVIPSGITSIDASTFNGCTSLSQVTFPSGLQSIGNAAFLECSSLTNINFPDSCVTIGDTSFSGCSNLVSVEISDKAQIARGAFFNCFQLLQMKIRVSDTDGTVSQTLGVKSDETTFGGDTAIGTVPTNRVLTFLKADGSSELTNVTTPTKTAAQRAYQNVNDGDTTDNYWYGWSLGAIENLSYAIDISVKKDNALWTDHGKTFVLSSDGTIFLTDLTAVDNGTYRIYEVTADGRKDTGMDVTVADGNAQAEVSYYTVTFYDGDTAYGADTDFAPQVLLKGEHPQEPSTEPTKEDYTFLDWVRTDGGTESFDFTEAVNDTTAVYANWVQNPVPQHTITAAASTGGSISPA
jgi:guanyl-specific ribonuclease Sa